MDNNNILQVFNCDQFQNLRVIRRGEDFWFFAKDVCLALGLSNTGQALSQLKKSEKSPLTHAEGNIILNGVGSNGESKRLHDFSNGGRAPMLISEAGLYKLTMKSRKAVAEAFKDWLSYEVLPALRKTGTYSLAGKVVDGKELPHDYLSALKALVVAEEEKQVLAKSLEKVSAERDEAIRTKAWISGKKTATAMGTAGGYAIRNQKLSEENAELRGKIWGLLNNSSIKYCIEALLSLPVAR